MGARFWKFAAVALSFAAAFSSVSPLRWAWDEAAAQREGLCLTFAAVEEKGLPVDGVRRSAAAFNRRTTSETSNFRLEVVESAMTQWQAASETRSSLPRKRFFDQDGSDYAYASELREGVGALIREARAEKEPSRRLLCAARFLAMLRQTPEYWAQVEGVRLGTSCLRAAIDMRIGRQVEAVLGSPTDFRSFLRPLLPRLLEQPNVDRPSAIRGWRNIWAALPVEPRDYDGAARVLMARLPSIDRPTPVLDCTKCAPYRPSEAAEMLREVERFESMREAIRTSSLAGIRGASRNAG